MKMSISISKYRWLSTLQHCELVYKNSWYILKYMKKNLFTKTLFDLKISNILKIEEFLSINFTEIFL